MSESLAPYYDARAAEYEHDASLSAGALRNALRPSNALRIRTAMKPIHYFLIEARPRRGAQVDGGSAGARVSCWIDFPLREGALAVATHYLQEDGWRPGRLIRQRVLLVASDVDTAAREHVREAQRHGACFVYRHVPKPRTRATVAAGAGRKTRSS
jgi:hypothetical protein